MSERHNRPTKKCKTRKRMQKHVMLGTIDFTVGWFLGDQNVWTRLRELYYMVQPVWRDGKAKFVSIPIPLLPPVQGTRWLAIFKHVYFEFKRWVPDRWESYGLSYEALRDCTLRGQQNNYSYVYCACANIHRNFIRSEKKHENTQITTQNIDPWPVVDFTLDFDDAMVRLDETDQYVVREYLIGNRNLAEIGESLNLHESSVCRRFQKSLIKLQSSLKDYKDAS